MSFKNLPVGQYEKIEVNYVPLVESFGTCCDNCGRLIANLVTVKHTETSQRYIIGQDCAKTLFSDAENKIIDGQIKTIIRNKKNAEKSAQRLAHQQKWDAAYKELCELWERDGGNAENINEQWSRDIFNTHLAAMTEKHGIHIGYKR